MIAKAKTKHFTNGTLDVKSLHRFRR